uniref:Mirror-image polydactyly 1 n=1 Tax=Poecilia formosa TaxID=48698 RepID=A0A087XTG9_POEFO
MEAGILQSDDPFPWAESSQNCLDEEAALRGPKSPVLERNLEPAGNSSPQISASSPRQTVTPTRNISFLLKELDAMRELNNKLQVQMVQKEKELLQREVDEELKEQQREARHWERPMEVLEEMLAAQKDRDQALMSRLLLANEERDEALLRARRLQEAAGSDDISLQDVDMDIKDLLEHVCEADSVQEVRQFGSALVQRVRLAQQRRSDITAQEMKAVIEERDKSVDKSMFTQQDNDGMVRSNLTFKVLEEMLAAQKDRDQALMSRLLLANEERDEALLRARRLQ